MQNVSFYMFTISIMKWQENAQVMTQVNKVGKVMFWVMKGVIYYSFLPLLFSSIWK